MPSKYLHRRIKHALRWEAARWWLRLHPKAAAIAIGGSVGKTTTKDTIAAVLSQKFPVVKSRANFDPIFNLPQTALKVRGRAKFVAEMGIDAPGQMDTYLGLISPSIAVMTELSLEHSDADHLQSLEVAIKEEWKLIEALPAEGWAIMNGDNDHIHKRAKTVKANVILYGFRDYNDVHITETSQAVEGGQAWLTITVKGRISGTFSAPLLGSHNGLCMAAAICIGDKLGLTAEQIQTGLKSVEPPPHRLQVVPTQWGIMIDDTYNSSPKAAMAAIDVLVDVGGDHAVLVLGDMLELGDYATKAHKELGAYAAKKGIKRILTYGDFSMEIATGYINGKSGGSVETMAEHQDIINWVKKHQPSVVLFKASRGMKLDHVVTQLSIH